MNIGSWIIPCLMCHLKFKSELDMRTHAMYRHGKLIPACSSGIMERIVRQEMRAIKRRKESMTTFKGRYKWGEGGNTYGNSSLVNFKPWMKFIERGFIPSKRGRHKRG